MEKLLALKNKLKFLRKVAVPFQGSILSPTTEARLQFRQSSSGSIIPKEARRKSKEDNSFVTKEPSSPKVSCIGQIYKKKEKKLMKLKSQNNRNVIIVKALPPKEIKKPQVSSKEKKTKTKNSKKNLYSSVSKQSVETEENRAPSLGKMKKMSSGRATLSNFDWKAHANSAAVVPVPSNYDAFKDLAVDRKSEEQKVEEEEAKNEDFTEIEVMPKKEVNLWKRRTAVPPPRLQV